MNAHNPLSPPPRDRDGARRKAQTHFNVPAQRESAVMQEMTRERVASEANTAKLRALRLAKEDTDREEARLAAVNAPPPKAKKPRKKFVLG